MYLLIYLLLLADSFIPEYGTDVIAADGESVRYNNGKYMRSGRDYFITKDEEDYLKYYNVISTKTAFK